jgi:hypothetical protein
MATSKNPITGDLIQTKLGDQHSYSNGWDRIFGKGSLADVIEQQEHQDATTTKTDTTKE